MITRLQVKLLRISTFFFYNILVQTYFLITFLFFRTRVEGRKNIPPKGRYIVACNHKNFFDGFIVALAFRTYRLIRFIIAKRAVKNTFFELLARLIGSIVIGDDIEDYQRALKKLNRILFHGGRVGIFPEGNVSNHKMPRRFKGGVAKLSLDSKTKVIPVYVSGTYNLRFFKYWLTRPEILVKIGKPVDLYNYANECNHDLDAMTEVLRKKVIELMDVKVLETSRGLPWQTPTSENPLEKTVLEV